MRRILKSIKITLLYIADNLFGKSSYKKFVVIATARTGSNLLISLLRNHSDMRVHGERFTHLNGKTCRQIYHAVYPKKSLKKVVGFKIFYCDPQNTKDREVWKLLQNDTTIKIIHLQRKNLLRSYISYLIARKTRVWIIHRNLLRFYISYLLAGKTKAWISYRTNSNSKKVYVNINELFERYEYTKKCINRINAEFKNHSILNLTYEELNTDQEMAMKKVFDFLGVSYQKVTCSLKKQNTERIEDLVSNFSELSRALEGSDLESMLMDDN